MFAMIATMAAIYVAIFISVFLNFNFQLCFEFFICCVMCRLWQDAKIIVYLIEELEKENSQGQSAISVDDTLKIIACREQQKKLSTLEMELAAARQEGFVSKHLSGNDGKHPTKKGYLDPEYFLTHKLTDKSDVYILGVVFLEILTGMKPITHWKKIVHETAEWIPTCRDCVERFLTLALSCWHDNT